MSISTISSARKVCPAPPPGESWYRIYLGDRRSMLETMIENMYSDLEYGYDPLGKSISEYECCIEEFKIRFKRDLFVLHSMTKSEKESFCYYRLLELGAIEAA